MNGSRLLGRAFLLVLLCLGASRGAYAAAAEAEESPVYGTLEGFAALWQPRDPLMKQFAGSGGSPAYGGRLAWTPFRWLGIRGSLGVSSQKVTGGLLAQIQGETLEFPSIHRYSLQEYQGDLTLLVAADFDRDQVLVPFAGGGPSFVYWTQTREDGDRLSGGKRGWHGLAGLRVNLNQVELRHARKLDDEFGINSTNLSFEAKTADIGQTLSGKRVGFNFSGLTFSASLLFEF